MRRRLLPRFLAFRRMKCNYSGKKVRNMRDKWQPSGRGNSGNGLKVVGASLRPGEKADPLEGNACRVIWNTLGERGYVLWTQNATLSATCRDFFPSSALLNPRPRRQTSPNATQSMVPTPSSLGKNLPFFGRLARSSTTSFSISSRFKYTIREELERIFIFTR